MKNDNLQPCCPAWARAHEWETDNEGYAPLIFTHDEDDEGMFSRTGYYNLLPDIRFCPWCGAEKKSRHPKQT